MNSRLAPAKSSAWSMLLAFLTLSLLGCTRTDPRYLLLPGIVETQEVRLSSRVGGRVEKVLVKEGDTVEAAQALVVLDTAELDAKRAQLIAQQDLYRAKLELMCNGPLPEEVSAARSALEMTEANLRRLETGWRTEEIQIAKFESESASAEYERALAEYNRLRPLAAANSVSQAELEAAKAAMLRAKSQNSSTAKNLEMLVKGTRAEDLEQARAQVEKSRADYDLIKRGARDEERRQAQAQIDEVAARIQELDVQLRECTVTAPQRCRVETIAIRRGDVVAPNQPVVRVLYDEDLWVKAYVPETQLAKIKLNDVVEVTHDGSDKVYQGKISHIANVSEFTPRNVQSPDERHNQVFGIKILIQDGKDVFKSGMAAMVRIPANVES